MALEPKTISAGDEPNSELADMQRRFWVSLVLTIPVLIAAMGEMIPGQPLRQLASQRTWTWVELILSSPVILWGGWPFFVRGSQSIVNRKPDMLTLIGMGVSVAYGSVSSQRWRKYSRRLSATIVATWQCTSRPPQSLSRSYFWARCWK